MDGSDSAGLEIDEASRSADVGTAPSIVVKGVNVYYGGGKIHALRDVTLSIPSRQVTAFIGASGCGKSSLLRCFNRMNDIIPDFKKTGSITVNGADIYSKNTDTTELRAKVGMVFQKANPFAKSIYENVAYGVRIHSLANKDSEIDEVVKASLERAGLWPEVRDRLSDQASRLSGGQQQRLCIARAIAMNPEVLLMDEPCSALDPIATATIEELIEELKQDITIVIVTHNMQQAARVSQQTAYFHVEGDGEKRTGYLAEIGDTEQIFTAPREEVTQGYITGRFG